MTWGISLRRADAVKQADLIAACHDGVLGVWRVTDASLIEHPGGQENRFAVQLTLVQQGVGRPSMLQLQDETALMLVLYPLPEPERIDLPEQLTRLLLAMELERLERMGYESFGVGAARQARIRELRSQLGWLP